ncbi:hypothetical protein [Lactobacillus bombicola]|uniref:Surface layer protein A domain-containing protein n=1 Tax=Lactobacillus bombicola TaxID=1505723 RepID=A0A396SU55_9LACO|nr:hypothetical protein [Lactobacillus bombicola]RHW55156.1 hypothetical protein DS835_00845 [Lactobacillus bombicola]
MRYRNEKKQKIIVSLTAAALLTTPIIITSINQAHAAQTTDQTQNKTTTRAFIIKEGKNYTLTRGVMAYLKKGRQLSMPLRSKQSIIRILNGTHSLTMSGTGTIYHIRQLESRNITALVMVVM